MCIQGIQKTLLEWFYNTPSSPPVENISGKIPGGGVKVVGIPKEYSRIMRKNFFQGTKWRKIFGNSRGQLQKEIDILNIGGTTLFWKSPVNFISATAPLLLYFSMRTNTKHFSCKRSGCEFKIPIICARRTMYTKNIILYTLM